MVIVLVKLSHHKEIDRQRVSRFVAEGKVAVSVSMSAPIDDPAVEDAD